MVCVIWALIQLNDSIASVFVAFLYILIVLIIGRSLMSWFPVSQGNQFARMLFQVTEPILDPIRQLMNRLGLRLWLWCRRAAGGEGAAQTPDARQAGRTHRARNAD